MTTFVKNVALTLNGWRLENNNTLILKKRP